jgi:hypothetical protein
MQHIKNFLSGVFKHAGNQGYSSRAANPCKMAEAPTGLRKPCKGRAYPPEVVERMLNLLSSSPLAATAVACAAYTGLRLGELKGLEWTAYSPAKDDDSLGELQVTPFYLARTEILADGSLPSCTPSQSTGTFVFFLSDVIPKNMMPPYAFAKAATSSPKSCGKSRL